jgi:hypothetical protein
MKANAHNSRAAVSVIILGYLISIAGALSVFSVPVTVSLVTLLSGGGITALASRRDHSAPRFTLSMWIAWLVGSAVILGALWLIGEDTVRHWTPHPAGYQIVWLIVLTLFRHLHHIFRREVSTPSTA